jgi:hypothetical protein
MSDEIAPKFTWSRVDGYPHKYASTPRGYNIGFAKVILPDGREGGCCVLYEDTEIVCYRDTVPQCQHQAELDTEKKAEHAQQ